MPVDPHSRALQRLQKKLENEVLWLYIAHILKGRALSIVELRKELKERFGIKVNTFNLYSIVYRMEKEALVRRVEGEEPNRYTLTEYGDIVYRKALLYLEERLLLLKKDLS